MLCTPPDQNGQGAEEQNVQPQCAEAPPKPSVFHPPSARVHNGRVQAVMHDGSFGWRRTRLAAVTTAIDLERGVHEASGGWWAVQASGLDDRHRLLAGGLYL